jgi:hypothetical protein
LIISIKDLIREIYRGKINGTAISQREITPAK